LRNLSICRRDGTIHLFIAPNTTNANADIETSLYYREEEFYDVEQFENRKIFPVDYFQSLLLKYKQNKFK